MESTVSIGQFQDELQSWKRELSSIKHEIRHFEHHLENLAAKKIPKHLLAEVEHFQNSFICQKEVIDKLRHDLPDSQHKVEHIFKNIHSSSEDHLAERMETFRRIYSEVKAEFKRFEAEWL